MLADKILRIAKAEIGVREIGNTNCGTRVNEYKAATWLDPKKAWPWCAAFIDWVVWQAMKEGEAEGEVYTFKRPRTAGAWDLENWSLEQDSSTSTRKHPGQDIKAGDIVIFTYSHVGFAISDASTKSSKIITVEGNTSDTTPDEREGGGVFQKNPSITKVKTRIRFTV